MAIRRRLGDGCRSDHAAAAGAAGYDHGLPPALRKALPDHAGNIVGGAARHERDDKLDLLGRIDLGSNG
jgi:hypothetical protein